jgi:hypothetical protein
MARHKKLKIDRFLAQFFDYFISLVNDMGGDKCEGTNCRASNERDLTERNQVKFCSTESPWRCEYYFTNC